MSGLNILGLKCPGEMSGYPTGHCVIFQRERLIIIIVTVLGTLPPVVALPSNAIWSRDSERHL